MYENIKNLIAKEHAQAQENTRRAILENEWTLKRFLTDLRVRQLTNGNITKEKAIELAFKKADKENAKIVEKRLARLESAENAAGVLSVSISVEWSKSRMWGYNPHATVIIEDTSRHCSRYYGNASGCGYDKLSAAVATALNQSNVLLKALLDVKEKALETIESTGAINEDNRNFISYGAGYGAIPYFEGGVGMSSLESVLNKCRLTLVNNSHGKMYDTFYFEVR